MKDDVLNLVCSFIADEAGRDENKMEGGTMLEKDLGIYGDDACELIVKFGKHFHVDVSRFLAAVALVGKDLGCRLTGGNG